MRRWDRSDTEALAAGIVLAAVTVALTELARWAASRWLPVAEQPKEEGEQ